MLDFTLNTVSDGVSLFDPGLNLQRSVGCNRSSPADREVPAYCQLDRGG